MPFHTSDLVGVFGANGFIGRHLVRRLYRDGIRCVAFGRDFPADYAAQVAPVERRKIDFANVLETHAALQGVTRVVQLINSSGPALGNQRVHTDLTANVLPHVGFIESCIMSGVHTFVFVSSGGTIYGVPQAVPIAEGHPLDPLNSYGMTKLLIEQYLRLLTRGTAMGYTALRVSNAFGPGQEVNKGQGLIPAVLRQHRHGAAVTIFGDGRAERDYVFVDDLVDALAQAITSEPTGGAINIGSGVGHSILDVIAAIEGVLGTAIPRTFVPARSTDTPSNVLDIRAAEASLGWRPRVSFGEGLSRTIASWQD